jgi:hypothetical protein
LRAGFSAFAFGDRCLTRMHNVAETALREAFLTAGLANGSPGCFVVRAIMSMKKIYANAY